MHTIKISQGPPSGSIPNRKSNRLVRAFTNPTEVVSALILKPKETESQTRRLEDSKFARALGGMGLDYGIGQPDQPKELPPADSPLFSLQISQEVEDKLPRGYSVRSLRRSDYDRGYTKLKSVGAIASSSWDERCEYMRSRADTYTVLVITDNNDQIVATGTLLIERKFANGMSLVGHIEDLAIGDGQSGKNLGLRMLEQLDELAQHLGCSRTVLGCQENNETFHKQRGFRRSGVEMSHSYPSNRYGLASDGSKQARAEIHIGDASAGLNEREGADAAVRLSQHLPPTLPQEHV